MSFTKHRLDDFCEIIMGQAPSGEAYNFEGKGWPLIAGAGDFGEVYPKTKKYTTEASKISQYGDIILGIRASIGDKVLSDGEYCLGRGVACLRPRSELDSRYLWHWLDSIRDQLSSKSKGATFKQVNRSDISELDISLPPLKEQRRIAEILDRAEEIRSKRREAIAQLDTLTQAIFLEMFGDPLHSQKRANNVCLSEVTINITDGTHLTPKFINAGVPFIFVKNIKNGDIDFQTDKFISEEEHQRLYKRCPVEEGDILYTTVGATYGQAAPVGSFTKFAFQRHIAHLKPDKNKILTQFLGTIMQLPCVKSQADRWARGAAQPTINLKELREFVIPLPPLHLQHDFARRVEAVEKLKNAHCFSLSELDALFASLQHRAFRGEL